MKNHSNTSIEHIEEDVKSIFDYEPRIRRLISETAKIDVELALCKHLIYGIGRILEL